MTSVYGSHNSMTYLTPDKWWMKASKVFWKCQSNNIQQQFLNGSRCFDLRLYWNKDKCQWCFAHGKATFGNMNITPTSVLIALMSYMDHLSNGKTNEKIFIRLILEKYESKSYETRLFRQLCESFEINPNYKQYFIFIGGNRKDDWLQVYNFNGNDEYVPQLNQYVGSMASDARFYEKIFPKLYANRKNKENKEKCTSGINIFDFV